jgi:hypothetical protein
MSREAGVRAGAGAGWPLDGSMVECGCGVGRRVEESRCRCGPGAIGKEGVLTSLSEQVSPRSRNWFRVSSCATLQ